MTLNIVDILTRKISETNEKHLIKNLMIIKLIEYGKISFESHIKIMNQRFYGILTIVIFLLKNDNTYFDAPWGKTQFPIF